MRSIYKNYIRKHVVELSPAVRAEIEERLEEGSADSSTFDRAQREFESFLERAAYPKFLQSDLYVERVEQTHARSPAALTSSAPIVGGGGSAAPSEVCCPTGDSRCSVAAPGSSPGSAGEPASSSGCEDGSLPVLPPQGLEILPTLREDEELGPEWPPPAAALTRRNVRKMYRYSDLVPRLAKAASDAPVAVATLGRSGTGGSAVPNPYHVRNSYYVPPSAQDSELHSLSSGAYTDDTSTEIDVNPPMKETRSQRASQGAAIRKNANINRDSLGEHVIIPVKNTRKLCFPSPFSAALMCPLVCFPERSRTTLAEDIFLLASVGPVCNFLSSLPSCLVNMDPVNMDAPQYGQNFRRPVSRHAMDRFANASATSERPIIMGNLRYFKSLAKRSRVKTSLRAYVPRLGLACRNKVSAAKASTAGANENFEIGHGACGTALRSFRSGRGVGLSSTNSVANAADPSRTLHCINFARTAVNHNLITRCKPDVTAHPHAVADDGASERLGLPQDASRFPQFSANFRNCPFCPVNIETRSLDYGRLFWERNEKIQAFLSHYYGHGPTKQNKKERRLVTCSFCRVNPKGKKKISEPLGLQCAYPEFCIVRCSLLVSLFVARVNKPNRKRNISDSQRKWTKTSSSSSRGSVPESVPISGVGGGCTLVPGNPGLRPPSPPLPSEATVIGYCYSGETVPYRTKLAGRNITLRQFKALLSKKGNYRYFFRCSCHEFGTDVVSQEISDDNEVLPLWEGKIFATVVPLD
ncbi:unnamed protein product [Ixodes hexagonus]